MKNNLTRKDKYVMKQQQLEKLLKKMCTEVESCAGPCREGFILVSKTSLPEMAREARVLMKDKRESDSLSSPQDIFSTFRSANNRAQERRIDNGGKNGGSYE